MMIDRYWLETLWKQWNHLAKALEEDAKKEAYPDTQKELLLKARLWRRAATQLKNQVEIYEMPERKG